MPGAAKSPNLSWSLILKPSAERQRVKNRSRHFFINEEVLFSGANLGVFVKYLVFLEIVFGKWGRLARIDNRSDRGLHRWIAKILCNSYRP